MINRAIKGLHCTSKMVPFVWKVTICLANSQPVRVVVTLLPYVMSPLIGQKSGPERIRASEVYLLHWTGSSLVQVIGCLLFNSLAPGRSECDSKNFIFHLVLLIGILRSNECHRNLLMIRLVQVMTIRQQAITWANVEPDLCYQMASLGLNELKSSIILNQCWHQGSHAGLIFWKNPYF